MRKNLLETYSKQLDVAKKYVAKNYDGRTVSDHSQLVTAVVLDNTNRFMSTQINESMNTNATERSDLGAWKKFCLNLTNLAVPSLIANELVIVHPMTSYSGAVTYLKYVSKTDKGDLKKGFEFNSVFKLGDYNEARTNFTSQVIIDTITAAGSGVSGLTLTPMAIKRFKDAEGNRKDVKVVAADGAVTYFDVEDGEVVGYTPAEGDKVAYFSEEFQMEHVPAQDIPTIGPVMEAIPLFAKPRRIAVRYDQITAYQAKSDYGFSLDKQIAEQACGELILEIDNEIVGELKDMAGKALPELTWSKTQPHGVSKFEHYNGFLEILDKAQAVIYKRTKKFEANYMVCSRDVISVLRFVNGWKDAASGKKNGAYKAGTIGGLDVYVTPQFEEGEYIIGLNGSDMMSSAMVYAPYMALVPTQLLGTPDGGLAQGFSTYYATARLNDALVVAGKIVD